MIRGNVAVVRHGATAPSTQSGAVLLELSPSRMRDSGWDQLPQDVRFAGEALQKMRAPPWIATDQPANVKKSLANSEPSTHGTKLTYQDFSSLSAFGGKADLGRSCCVDAFDPKRTLTGLKSRRESEANPPYDGRSELGRRIAIDLQPDADLDKNRCCPGAHLDRLLGTPATNGAVVSINFQ